MVKWAPPPGPGFFRDAGSAISFLFLGCRGQIPHIYFAGRCKGHNRPWSLKKSWPGRCRDGMMLSCGDAWTRRGTAPAGPHPPLLPASVLESTRGREDREPAHPGLLRTKFAESRLLTGRRGIAHKTTGARRGLDRARCFPGGSRLGA